jgi:hypothetical protein
MASFNLADYETVEQRIKRFYTDNPNGRIITKNKTSPTDRAVSTWVVKAEIWLPMLHDEATVNARFLEDAYLKATGWAFEIDGQGMANKTSALENAETSAIGRALANAGYSGNKRASREEMAKVARQTDNTDNTDKKRDWLGEADKLALTYDVDGLRLLYTDAVAANAGPKILEKIKAYGSEVSKP